MLFADSKGIPIVHYTTAEKRHAHNHYQVRTPKMRARPHIPTPYDAPNPTSSLEKGENKLLKKRGHCIAQIVRYVLRRVRIIGGLCFVPFPTPKILPAHQARSNEAKQATEFPTPRKAVLSD